jgi:GTP-binding protein|tara:strand:- start:3573 stop:5456 length:1884 start_codon:yes stop_codon:yes gene_type:complete
MRATTATCARAMRCGLSRALDARGPGATRAAGATRRRATTTRRAAGGGTTTDDDDDDARARASGTSAIEMERMDREARTYATAWANELASTLSEDARALERRLFGDEGGASERGEDEDEDASEEETVGTSGRKGKARADARVRRKTRRDWSKVPDEALPRVAVVGRPNVGKSALFNRLTGTKRAIVYDEPGVTRDRMYVRAYWGEHEFMMVDTGGLENLPANPEGGPKTDTVGGVEILPGMIEAQAAEAVREASVLIFVVDGQVGLTAADMDIFAWLRRTHSKIPLHLAVNKCESTTKGEDQILEFWSLGDVTPLAVSAISGTGTGELLDNMCATLPPPPQVSEDENAEEEDIPVTVAIIGRPNVGKSSLLNGLAGEARSIVSDFSGTTRDSIDTLVEDKYTGRKFTLIDTAGIRRRTQVKSGTDGAEKLSVGRALQAMKRADVVVLVIDGTEGPSQQDFVLAERATQEGCAIVLCINKWDLVDKDTHTMNKYTDDMRLKLRVFEYAEIVYTSALTGQRIQKILDAAQVASENHRKRLTTATLNSVVQEATLWKLPPSRNSRKGKIYYITQASIRPPTFVFFVNDPKLFPDTYRRYMERQLRENIGFPGTPIRLLWRGKGVEKGPRK